MPYPRNIEVALELEGLVRENGAVPATIAIIDGMICIGLDSAQIDFLGNSSNICKASRRDIPVAISKEKSAATTVSATMICAHYAGIKFFATGGIGGVHRGAKDSFDISADLQELAKTPVAVVCAGAKAILDIPATLEYLETNGIPVLGYKTGIFPAFYYADSGSPVQEEIDSPSKAAEIFRTMEQLNYNCGIIIGNPVPEKYAMDKKEIEHCIEIALKDADDARIYGQAVTPFLLDRLFKITRGKSLETNIALVENNVSLCARIAIEYHKNDNK
jgi:pseudouridine-5'-phosphate glycosidase